MNNFKVIKILDEYSILINYGFKNKAQSGDRLRIYIPGEEVTDPSTGEFLGTLDKIKDVVEVTTPYENFSICKKVSNKIVDVLNPLSAFSKNISTISKLNVDNAENESFQIKSDEPIKLGDIATLLPC